MEKEELKRFLSVQDDILTNLASLRTTVMTCVDEGMEDPDSALYNELNDLIDSGRAIDNIDELTEISIRGQAIERNLDIYLSSKGMTTINLTWPVI